MSRPSEREASIDRSARAQMRIGVLALHGAFIEHIRTLESIGVDGTLVRLPQDLEGLNGLIIPGGESTTMRILAKRWELQAAIMDLARSGVPILGTCAGMIVVAREIAGGEDPVFPLVDITVRRNAFGRQLDSFETDLEVPIIGDRPIRAIFIRAPVVERVGPAVEVLATLPDGRVVAVRQDNVIALAFHPELAGETRLHRLMAAMASEHAEPGEGSVAGTEPWSLGEAS
jgi:5'-phosphate synthase pdxT subunit